jgi:metal-responsive CopG/Arc/MetJ family transcriptional regulator
MKRKRFTSTIDPQLIQRIKTLAIKQRKRFNELLEDAIRDYLKEYEKKTKG